MRPKEFELDDVADAAMRVFLQHGYAATSIQDLVEGTGLGRGSLYNAFGSKHGLYEFALRRYYDVTALNVELLLERGMVKDLIRKLLMRIVEDEVGNSVHSGCMVANASLELAGHDKIVAELVAQNFTRMETALHNAFQRAQKNKEIASHKNPLALARFVMNTIQGLRVLGRGSIGLERTARLLHVVEVTIDAL